jgi:AcrR family transcriptional regulator
MSTAKAQPKTRERLLDAALDLFAEEGFTGTTISEVERRVGLAAGTGSFYRHFSSKQALLRAAVEREIERCLAEIESDRASRPVPDGSRDQFVAASHQILRDVRRFDRLFRLMLAEGDRVPDLREAFTAALEGSGAISWMSDPWTSVRVAALIGYHVFDLVGGGPFREVGQDQFVAALADIFERAEGPDPTP